MEPKINQKQDYVTRGFLLCYRNIMQKCRYQENYEFLDHEPCFANLIGCILLSNYKNVPSVYNYCIFWNVFTWNQLSKFLTSQLNNFFIAFVNVLDLGPFGIANLVRCTDSVYEFDDLLEQNFVKLLGRFIIMRIHLK